jgi:DNA-binding response OmpR family regulator
MECDLLAAFARNRNCAPHETLLDLAHGHDNEVFDRSMDVCIERVRCELERDPEKPQVIQPIRGAPTMCIPSKP